MEASEITTKWVERLSIPVYKAKYVITDIENGEASPPPPPPEDDREEPL